MSEAQKGTWENVVTYGSPIFKAVQQKRRKALYRALKKSPKSPEFAVGRAQSGHMSVGLLGPFCDGERDVLKRFE